MGQGCDSRSVFGAYLNALFLKDLRFVHVIRIFLNNLQRLYPIPVHFFCLIHTNPKHPVILILYWSSDSASFVNQLMTYFFLKGRCIQSHYSSEKKADFLVVNLFLWPAFKSVIKKTLSTNFYEESLQFRAVWPTGDHGGSVNGGQGPTQVQGIPL